MSIEKHWGQIERVLSTISRWLTVKCAEYMACESNIAILLKCHKAYIESAEHSVKCQMLDQFVEIYSLQDFIGLMGSVSVNCHRLGLKFIMCMKEVQ
jgi:hypothetical protein